MLIHRSYNVRFYFLHLNNFCFLRNGLPVSPRGPKFEDFHDPSLRNSIVFCHGRPRQGLARGSTWTQIVKILYPYLKNFIVFLKVAPRHAMAVLPRGPKFEDFLDNSVGKSMIFENLWPHVTSRSFTSYVPCVTTRYNLSSVDFFNALWCK